MEYWEHSHHTDRIEDSFQKAQPPSDAPKMVRHGDSNPHFTLAHIATVAGVAVGAAATGGAVGAAAGSALAASVPLK